MVGPAGFEPESRQWRDEFTLRHICLEPRSVIQQDYTYWKMLKVRSSRL